MSRIYVVDSSGRSMINMEYDTLKNSGITGVILRAGFGNSVSQKDAYFDQAYQMAKDAGLLVGAYWFNYFRSNDDAIAEAEACNDAIGDKELELGIYGDYEEDTIAYMDRSGSSKDDMTSRIVAFCVRLSELRPADTIGWYANPSCIAGKNGATALDMSRLAEYPLWLALYNGNEDTDKPGSTYDGVIVSGHQFGNNDQIPSWVNGYTNIDISAFETDAFEIHSDSSSTACCGTSSNGYGVKTQVNIGGSEQWLPEVDGEDANMNDDKYGYAGKIGRTIEAIKISMSGGASAGYSVHTKDGQTLSEVSTVDADINNSDYGYAGIIGHEIDAIQISLPDNADFDIIYRVQLSNGKLLPEVKASDADWSNDDYGYAGSFGETIERVYVKVVNR